MVSNPKFFLLGTRAEIKSIRNQDSEEEKKIKNLPTKPIEESFPQSHRSKSRKYVEIGERSIEKKFRFFCFFSFSISLLLPFPDDRKICRGGKKAPSFIFQLSIK